MADNNDFKFTIPVGQVHRSLPTHLAAETALTLPPHIVLVEAYASSADTDAMTSQMSEGCIIGWVNCINEGQPVPVVDGFGPPPVKTAELVGVDNEHSEHWTDQIGWVVRAEVRYEVPPELAGATPPLFWVLLAINTRMAHGQDLINALEDGVKLGLSIAGSSVPGKVTQVVNAATGQLVKRYDEIRLRKISVTKQPANPFTWLAKVMRSLLAGEQTVDNEQEQEQATQPANDVERTDAQAPEVDEPVAEAVAVERVAEGEVERTTKPQKPAVTKEAAAEAAESPEEEATESPAEESVEDDDEATPPKKKKAAAKEAGTDEVARSLVTAQTDVLRTLFEARVADVAADVQRTLAAQKAEFEAALGQAAQDVTVLRSLVADLTPLVQAQATSLAEYVQRTATQADELAALKAALAEAREEITALGDEPAGRKGLVVRSRDGKEEVPADKRREVLDTLQKQGRGDLAALMVTGLL